MEKILGIDLGSNSVGWAIREISNKPNQIIDKGVLIFNKGVGIEKGVEVPLVKQRTEARGKRRNYQAEKYRKWELLKFLIENKMCPLTIDELNQWKKYTKGFPRKYPESPSFIKWLRFDFNGDGKPDFEQLGLNKNESNYIFRVLAVSEENIHKKIFSDNPFILGRVFYHLVQRRGFRGRDEDEAKTIMQGSKESGAAGAEELKPYIEKYKTLGKALYYLQKETGCRIRKRYNLRTDYELELKEICRVQNISDDQYKKLWKAIIWQRPLRSQKGLVGTCIYERNKPRCPVSHPVYEEYRTWIFINNLKIVLPAEIDKDTYIKEKIYPMFHIAAKDFKLEKILKVLIKDGGEIKSNFRPDTKIISCSLQNHFKILFGENWKDNYSWNEILNNKGKKCKYSFEDIWHVLFTFDSKEKLKEFALTKLRLDGEKANKFSNIKLQQGYTTLSLSAIKKILPYLKRGFIYSEAVYLANMHKILGKNKLEVDFINNFIEDFKKLKKEHKINERCKEAVNGLINDCLNDDKNFRTDQSIRNKLIEIYGEKSWVEKITEEERNDSIEFVSDYLGTLKGPIRENMYLQSERLHDKIFNYIKEKYQINEKQKNNLWHPSEQEVYKEVPEINGLKYLGDPQPLKKGFKNPMALRTLHELKKLLNYLLKVNKIDENTRIVIEIARELNDSNMRKAIERYQREREKENNEFRKKIEEIVIEHKLNIDINKEIINKYRLWIEQKCECIYTGKKINCTEFFDGSKYNIEHTIPASMSYDNELKNLTIADIDYNMNIKKKRIPTELENYYEECEINGIKYPAIKQRIKFIKDKVEQLAKLLDEWKNKSKTASNKEIKDSCIQRKHMIKFELDYWRRKLDTFTCVEYKLGWRNSQLKDTQIVTKYALPYLKTVFKKVEVQKGTVTAAFREIYNIQDRNEIKNRDKHSHHAIDAAVLTLIPAASKRDKILLKYNERKDNNFYDNYSEIPLSWENYTPEFIKEIENTTLINYQPKHRTLTSTYKNVRKRGKQQFVKEKCADGSWQYKIDSDGKKIPLIAKGDTIRGQLHKESFFGAIKRNDKIWLVERYPISNFTSINDCKHIVDEKVKEIVYGALQKRMDEGLAFDKAKMEPIRFPNGKEVIKKVRCKVAAGRGYLTPEKSLAISKHTFISKHDYKKFIYAQNDENTLCLYYEAELNNKKLRAFRIVGLFELAQLNIACIDKIKEEKYYQTISLESGKNKIDLLLSLILNVGTKVIFFKNKIEEIKELTKDDLYKRIFRIYKFNEMGSPYIYLQNHIEARKNELLGDGDTTFDPAKYQYRLKLKANKFTCIIENIHFRVLPDGEIEWLF